MSTANKRGRAKTGAALSIIGIMALAGGLFAPVAGADPAEQAGQGQERAEQAQAAEHGSEKSNASGSGARGDDDDTSAVVVTEDNDKNDNNTPNNVSDDGDNKHPSGKDRSVEAGGSGNQGNSTSDPDDDGRGPDRSNGGADKPGGLGGDDLADQDGNNGCGNDDDFEDDNEGLCGGPEDVCPNINGKQRQVPAGMEKVDGDCVTAEVGGTADVCPNIDGDQAEVPEGLTVDDDGDCVSTGGSTPTPTPDEVLGVVITNPGTSPVITNPGPSVVVDQPAPQALTPEIVGERVVRSQAQPSSEVLGVQTVRGGQLPRTGSEATNLLTLSGIILLAGGMMLVLSNRSNRRLATITNS